VDGARSVTNQRQAGCGVENQGDACLGPERRLLYYDNVMFVIEQVQRIKAQSSSAASPPAFLLAKRFGGASSATQCRSDETSRTGMALIICR
jgi:hypothetical protein